MGLGRDACYNLREDDACRFIGIDNGSGHEQLGTRDRPGVGWLSGVSTLRRVIGASGERLGPAVLRAEPILQVLGSLR